MIGYVSKVAMKVFLAVFYIVSTHKVNRHAYAEPTTKNKKSLYILNEKGITKGHNGLRSIIWSSPLKNTTTTTTGEQN